MMMNTRWVVGVALALFLTGSLLPAHAAPLAGSGDPFTLLFDENGNGQVDPRDGTGFQPLPGLLMDDPTQPGTNVLTYLLPSPVITGDVRIWEDFLGGTLSDVLRFTNAAGDHDGGLNGNRLIFYSEVGEGALADTGIPRMLFPNDGGGILETGPEGSNSFVYAPGGPFDNVYVGTSDAAAVPEPSTYLLFTTGLLGLLAYGRRKRLAA